MIDKISGISRRLILPGLTLGFFMPLLITREVLPYLKFLPYTLPTGLLTIFSLTVLLKKLAYGRGAAAARDDLDIFSIYNPLVFLNFSYLSFIMPVPAIPFFMAAAVFGMIYYRVFNFLGKAGNIKAPCLELAGMLLPFAAAFFIFFQTNIIHDAFQYLSILVSVGRDFDLNFFNEVYIMNADRFYNPFAANSARYLGVPVLEAPFFGAGHVLACIMRLSGQFHAANGMSFPYVFMTSLASTFFGLGALLLIYLLCREFFPRDVSLLATVGYWLGSPLIFFTFCWNGWPHPFNVFFTVLFLLYWQRTRGRKKVGDWAALGTIGGILCLIRPTNAVLAFFPLFEIAEYQRKYRRLHIRYLKGPLIGALGAMLVFSPQNTIWKCISGNFWNGPYLEIGDYFDWTHPDFFGTLLSTARHGLFSWSPLLILATLGLIFLLRKSRSFGFLSILVVLLNVYIFSSWSVWWTGIGFSNRFFIEMSPFFVLGLAALMTAAERKKMINVEFATVVLSLFAMWNIFLIGEYRSQIIPYGIPDPGRVLDAPLTMASIIHNHLFVFPDKIGSLFKAQWSNANFFPSRILHAMTFDQPLTAGFILLVFLMIVWLFYLLSRFILNPETGAKLRRFLIIILPASSVLVLILHVVILGAGRNTVPFGNFYHFDAIDISVRKSGAEKYFYSTFTHPTINVDLLSHLVYSHSIRQGTAVALVSIYDQDDRRFDYTIRAGVDTAENSFFRPEYVKNIRHNLEKATIVRENMTSAYSSHVYPAITCMTTLELPEPLVVKKIGVRYRQNLGELIISDIFMRDF